MTALTAFLLENPVDNITQKVVLSKRLREHPFTIRAMSAEDFAHCQRAAVRPGAGGKSDFDTGRFNELVVVGHCVEPNFKDAAFVSQSGCATPEQLVAKTLLAGEISTLARKITELSGFGQSMDDLVDEAKNS